MEHKKIDEKIEERNQLIENVHKLQQQQQQVGQGLSNVQGRILQVEGWLECALGSMGVISLEEYAAMKETKKKTKKK